MSHERLEVSLGTVAAHMMSITAQMSQDAGPLAADQLVAGRCTMQLTRIVQHFYTAAPSTRVAWHIHRAMLCIWSTT